MNKQLMQSLVAWLGGKLEVQRNTIGDLVLRLRDVAMSMGNSLSLHRKFLRLLDEVALEREKELDLLHEIEDVELKHRLFRERNMLRRAEEKPRKRPVEDLPLIIEEAPKPPPNGLLKALLIWWFFLRDEKRPAPNA